MAELALILTCITKVDNLIGLARHEKITATTSIDALGYDSLNKIELLTEVEEAANRPIRESELQGIETVGDLAELLCTG